MPLAGPKSYIVNGRGDGAVIFLLALLSAWRAVRGRLGLLLWTGLACAATLTFTILRFVAQAAEVRARLAHGFGGGLGDLPVNAAGTVMPAWGCGVLVAGILLILLAGWRGRRGRR